MRTLVKYGGIIALVVLTSPQAAACHRFSVWKYPWRQACAHGVWRSPQWKGGDAHLEARFIGKAPVASHSGDGGVLPSLLPVDWGSWADDETQGRIKLRLELEGK
jgi:hypothetical protein